MLTGTVKRWYSGRGFGFIRRDDGAGDVFLHIKQVSNRREPWVGDAVSFEIGTDPKTGRPAAVNAEVSRA